MRSGLQDRVRVNSYKDWGILNGVHGGYVILKRLDKDRSLLTAEGDISV